MRLLRSVWLCAFVACSKSETPATFEAITTIVTPDPIDLRAIELDTTPASDAEVGMWVRCTGGSLRAGGRTERACAGTSQTFVGSTDRVAILVDAANAERLEIGGKRGRFIEQRARVELDLRPLIGQLIAASITDVTTLWVPLRMVGRGTAPSLEGELSFETPRVMALVIGIEGSGLRFGDDDQALPDRTPKVLFVGSANGAPDGATLAEIDLVALTSTEPTTVACGEGAIAAHATTLAVIDRRSGRRVGEKRWEARCDSPAPHIATFDDVLAATTSASIDPALTARGVNRMPATDHATIASATTFLGLDSRSGKAQVVRLLGKISGATPGGAGVETLTFGPDLGAMVDTKTSKLMEIWVVGAAGRDTLRSKQLDHALLAYIGQPLRTVVGALGAPSKVGEDFVSWIREANGITTYIEMQCPEVGGWICNELDVGWIASGE